MDIAETIDDLSENLLGEGFFKPSSLAHIVEQIATSTQLHHDDDMLLGLNCLVNLDYMIMPQLQQ